MQPTERPIEPRTPEQRTRVSERDVLREVLRDQSDRGQTKSDIVIQSVQKLLRRGAITNLSRMLGRMHPADIAKAVTHLSSPKEKREVFELVRGEGKRGQVLSELDGESIQQVVAAIRSSGRHAWIAEFERKYGLM